MCTEQLQLLLIFCLVYLNWISLAIPDYITETTLKSPRYIYRTTSLYINLIIYIIVCFFFFDLKAISAKNIYNKHYEKKKIHINK